MNAVAEGLWVRKVEGWWGGEKTEAKEGEEAKARPQWSRCGEGGKADGILYRNCSGEGEKAGGLLFSRFRSTKEWCGPT